MQTQHELHLQDRQGSTLCRRSVLRTSTTFFFGERCGVGKLIAGKSGLCQSHMEDLAIPPQSRMVTWGHKSKWLIPISHGMLKRSSTKRNVYIYTHLFIYLYIIYLYMFICIYIYIYTYIYLYIYMMFCFLLQILNYIIACICIVYTYILYVYMEVSENDGTPSHHPSFFGIFHFKPLDLGVFDL